MKIFFEKKMLKQYWKLRTEDRKRVDDAITLFRKNPFDATIKNHPLKGSMKGTRAISAGFDLRIVLKEHDGYVIVVMLAVGTHEGVY